jgi:hypothetical protein
MEQIDFDDLKNYSLNYAPLEKGIKLLFNPTIIIIGISYSKFSKTICIYPLPMITIQIQL